MIRTASMLVLLLAVCSLFGCATSSETPFHSAMELPTWLTAPQGSILADAPVNLNMDCPPHLSSLCSTYALPAWVVYGVVRCLGADEFVVNGIFRRFSLTDESGESNVVVDELHYDVVQAEVKQVLAGMACAMGEAETERDRMNILGSYVRRRFGAFVLFSLKHSNVAQGDAAGAPNLLLESGESLDVMETFDRDSVTALGLQPGWSETASYYQVVQAGDFGYGSPMASFMRTEEEAIHELARSLVVKFSHLKRQFSTDRSIEDDVQEEASREEIVLRMRGVRISRRVVDPGRRTCLVTVRVPRKGVALR